MQFLKNVYTIARWKASRFISWNARITRYAKQHDDFQLKPVFAICFFFMHMQRMPWENMLMHFSINNSITTTAEKIHFTICMANTAQCVEHTIQYNLRYKIIYFEITRACIFEGKKLSLITLWSDRKITNPPAPHPPPFSKKHKISSAKAINCKWPVSSCGKWQ